MGERKAADCWGCSCFPYESRSCRAHSSTWRGTIWKSSQCSALCLGALRGACRHGLSQGGCGGPSRPQPPQAAQLLL